MRRVHILVLLALAVLLLAGGRLAGADFSDATYVASSSNRGTVNAAADWTAPDVTLAAPSSPLQGTVTLTATATDAQSGIASVEFQYVAPGGSSWVTACIDTTAPFTCDWNTRLGADGGYQLRARATNGASYVTITDGVSVTVANNVLIVLGNPGDVVRGSVPLSTTIYNGGLSIWTITIQYAPAGTTNWKALCSPLGSLLGCTWSTGSFTNDAYDLRAVASSGLTTITSATISDVLVDNAAPTVTMTDPGSPLSGTVTLSATATDAGSGVSQVVIEGAPASGSYRTLCTITATPYSCRVATTTLTDGAWSFRATATDAAGNARTSTVIGSRVIDNTVSSVSVDDPGAYLRSTVAVTAQAASTAGVTSVRIQRSVAGANSWTDLCTDATAPYSCGWDTTTVADGSYDLRAILLDARGQTTTSAVVAGRRVDNSVLRAVDVQAANGGGTVGRIDQGDTLTLTYSERVTTGSVSAGWTGSALPVTLRVRDGNLLGTGNLGDTVDVLRSGTALPLGSVALRGDYVKSSRTLSFNATMSSTTVTVDGVERTVVTVTVGTLAAGSGSRTATTLAALVWTPSATVTSAASGRACSVVPATETGVTDRDF